MPTNPHLNQERADYLRNRTRIAKERLPQWPREDKMLEVVELEVDWVRFSTLNHRTTAERQKLCRDRNSPTLFESDPLGEVAQGAQRDLLRSHNGFSDLKGDLRERRQRETAVVTAEGILINGNRRVAALRDLYHDERNQDARYVRTFVLPADATADEIRELEAELQVSKTFLEPYSWINRGFLLQELLAECGQDFERVAELMRMDVKEVRGDDRKFKLVDQLVAMSERSYMQVDFEPNESAFEELSDHIASKSPAEASAVRYSYFLGILSDCAYRDLRHLRRANALDYVEQEIEENLLLERTIETFAVPPSGNAQSEVDELLGEALGPQAGGSKVERLVGFLAKKNQRDEILTLPGAESITIEALLQQVNMAVTQAARDAHEDDLEARTLQNPLKYVRDARDKIARATAALAQARALPDWSEPAFGQAVQQLINAIDELRKT